MRYKYSLLLIPVILALVIPACWSDLYSGTKADFTPLDSMIHCWVSRGYYPGASIAVSDGRTTLFQKYYGNHTSHTNVYVASAGKWIGAAVIAAVVDNTDLDWDDPVSYWLPEFKHDSKGGITLRQLLSHTSGIPDYHPLPKVDKYNSLDSAVADILPLDTISCPGKRFKYGGLAMQVAGRMAEVAGNASFEELFQYYIATPLGMGSTHFVPVDNAGGHSPMIAGGLNTTLYDYMQFLNMIFNAGMYDGRRILSSEVIDEMFADQVGDALVEPGEYVYKALGLKHNGVYGLGVWREMVDGKGDAYQVSSPGWAGAYPWINRHDGVYGFFLAHVEGNSAYKDDFSPFYNAPEISRTVTEILNLKNY